MRWPWSWLRPGGKIQGSEELFGPELALQITSLARMGQALTGRILKVKYIDMVPGVASEHSNRLIHAEKQYGDSWKKRGGVGAFMMLARKWDRIEMRLKRTDVPRPRDGIDDEPTFVPPYDIFGHIAADPRPEGLVDDVRDLIDYLILVEAEMLSKGKLAAPTAQHRPDEEHPHGYCGA